MQRRVVGDEVALITRRASVQQQASSPGISTPRRLPKRAPGLDQVIDLRPPLQQKLEQGFVPLERGPHERRPPASPEKVCRTRVRSAVYVGSPVEQQADGID